MEKTFLLLLAFNLCNYSFAQYSFQRYDTIAVRENNVYLPSPWAGGLNNPQFSAIDLDGDGKKDIFIYDRSSDKILTFLNIGQTGEAKYVHRLQYETLFPPLHNWVLLVDFNNDGKEDIFTSGIYNTQIGVAVYRNESDISGLKFVRMNPPLMLGDNIPIYVSQWDIPAIADVDSDGDTDILTFDFGGSYVLFFRNLSVENFGIPDSLLFTKQTNCWGNFSENWASCDVILNDSCGTIITEEWKNGIPMAIGMEEWKDGNPPQPFHAGSTMLLLEINGDTAHELLVGDILCTNMYLTVNGGDSLNANMIAVYPAYPLMDSISIYRFPAAFLLDVNNDGIKDLLSAPNALNVSENFRGVWYYRNDSTNTVPNFTFQTISFLQDEMIDVGENAHPRFFDYNADGKMDLLVGNYRYYVPPSGDGPSGIALYENIGTSSAPAFQLITRDYANLNALSLHAALPAFGDLDDDGDEDMIVGDFDGFLHYFENTAGAGNPANFSQKLLPGIDAEDIGYFAAPQLVDVTRDGKLDLLVGEYNGNLNYYENIGTTALPVFQLVTDSFGKVNVRTVGSASGHSVPFLADLDGFCNYTLLVGAERGYVFKYTNIDNNLNGIFTLSDTNFLGAYHGLLASPGGADINSDGTIDLAVGNRSGGVSVFLNQGIPATLCEPSLDTNLLIFPNPVTATLTLLIAGNQGDEGEITIYNLLGQKCFFEKIYATGNRFQETLSLQSFRSGLYIVKIKTPAFQTNQKIVVLKYGE